MPPPRPTRPKKASTSRTDDVQFNELINRVRSMKNKAIALLVASEDNEDAMRNEHDEAAADLLRAFNAFSLRPQPETTESRPSPIYLSDEQRLQTRRLHRIILTELHRRTSSSISTQEVTPHVDQVALSDFARAFDIFTVPREAAEDFWLPKERTIQEHRRMDPTPSKPKKAISEHYDGELEQDSEEDEEEEVFRVGIDNEDASDTSSELFEVEGMMTLAQHKYNRDISPCDGLTTSRYRET